MGKKTLTKSEIQKIENIFREAINILRAADHDRAISAHRRHHEVGLPTNLTQTTVEFDSEYTGYEILSSYELFSKRFLKVVPKKSELYELFKIRGENQLNSQELISLIPKIEKAALGNETILRNEVLHQNAKLILKYLKLMKNISAGSRLENSDTISGYETDREIINYLIVNLVKSRIFNTTTPKVKQGTDWSLMTRVLLLPEQLDDSLKMKFQTHNFSHYLLEQLGGGQAMVKELSSKEDYLRQIADRLRKRYTDLIKDAEKKVKK